MRDSGSLLHKLMVLSIELKKFDTDMGSCFPIKAFVSDHFSFLDGSQSHSKSKIAMFLNKVCSLVCSILNSFLEALEQLVDIFDVIIVVVVS